MKLTAVNKISNIKPKNIYSLIKSIFWQGAFYPFQVSIGFIVLSVIIGGVIYFQNKPQPQLDTIIPTKLSIQKKYSQLIKLLEERELKFEKASDQIDIDPFNLMAKEELKEKSNLEK